MKNKARVWERTHSPFTFHTWRGLEGQRYHLPNPLCVCDSEGAINKGRYQGQADEARNLCFLQQGDVSRNHGSCAKKLGPVCAPPMGGLKSKPRILPTFLLDCQIIVFILSIWLTNDNSTHTLWQQYNVLHAEILHLFLGDWLLGFAACDFSNFGQHYGGSR